jgi:hypothetical protein
MKRVFFFALLLSAAPSRWDQAERRTGEKEILGEEQLLLSFSPCLFDLKHTSTTVP